MRLLVVSFHDFAYQVRVFMASGHPTRKLGTGPARQPACRDEMQREPVFVIPTCRLRDVGETVRQYDRHFAENGHPMRIMIFDDSGPSLHEKYFSSFSKIKTTNELYYVGPREKAEFKLMLGERLADDRLRPLISELFRPSYGGNRNFTLAYTLGDFLISADDDMRPYALIDEQGAPLADNEICRGKLVKADSMECHQHRQFDIAGAFLEVLGKPVEQIAGTYARGELLVDTATDLETNASKGLSKDNSLLLRGGNIAKEAVVKLAQTFRSGTNDIDALDFIEMFLENPAQTSFDTLADVYVLSRFRPVLTDKNWRMDCGVAAYDNTAGLPPFFPTRLRFEDYIYRLWIQRPGIAAAHVPAAQNHIKSPYMRNPPASEILNEEVANFLKRKILGSLTGLSEVGIQFAYEGEVELEETATILDKVHRLYDRAQAAIKTASSLRCEELNCFAASLKHVCFGFHLDFFQYNLQRLLRCTVSAIKSSLNLWPQLLEICGEGARRRELPQLRVCRGCH